MKIGNPYDKPGLSQVGGQRNAVADSGTAKAGGAAAQSGSTVALSNTATALLRGTEGVQAASPEFDAGKVERISDAIAQGQFTVNAEAIADKLLANAQELLSRPS